MANVARGDAPPWAGAGRFALAAPDPVAADDCHGAIPASRGGTAAAFHCRHGLRRGAETRARTAQPAAECDRPESGASTASGTSAHAPTVRCVAATASRADCNRAGTFTQPTASAADITFGGVAVAAAVTSGSNGGAAAATDNTESRSRAAACGSQQAIGISDTDELLVQSFGAGRTSGQASVISGYEHPGLLARAACRRH